MKMPRPFLLVLAAGAAQAAPVAPKPETTPSVAPAAQAPAAKRFPGVSDEGNAVLAKAQTAPDPQQQSINRQLKAGDPDALKRSWQKFYFRGETVEGGKAEAHVNKRRLKTPERES